MTDDALALAGLARFCTLVCVTLLGPVSGVASACETILRSLPSWFGVEKALLEYARDTATYPTFVAKDGHDIVAFLTVREHFRAAWEVHCIAVHSARRGRGVGRTLHGHVERWLSARGALFLQVKTLAETHPSAEYAETRRFYSRIGYAPLEVFPRLWGPELPVLQLVKMLSTKDDVDAS